MLNEISADLSVQNPVNFDWQRNLEPEPQARNLDQNQVTDATPEASLPSRADSYRSRLLRHEVQTTFESNFSLETSVDALDPIADSSELVSVDTAADDFSQIGAAFANRPAPQTFWNEESINVVATEGLRQGGLTTDQAQQNAELARAALSTESNAAPLQISAGDLALIVRESGISFPNQDPNQLRAAASYLNDANNLTDQQERLRKTLDVFHTLDRQGPPQLTRDQMVGQLWVAARVPTHAIEKMNNAELARTVQSVASVVNGPAGEYKLKVGKHDVTLTVNDTNEVVNSKTKKPSVWAKIGRIALTVASFVPGPVGIAARIASSVISAAEGIKNKNWVQAVIGGASGVAAGASAIAGRAVSGAAATTARVASNIARGARAWQTGLQAFSERDGAGVFRSLAGIGSAVAGAVGDSAESVATWATNVERWAGRAYVAAEVRNISRMGWQDQLLAIGGHGANLILDSGDLRPATSSFDVKWKLGINLGQTVRAGVEFQRAIKSGDVLLMSEAATNLSATTHNAYRNAAATPGLLAYFDAQQQASQTTHATQVKVPDVQYDGLWIGNQGIPFVPAGQFTLPVNPAMPGGSLDSTVPTVYVNGILNTVDVQANFMSRLADASGSAVFGIHNATQGIVSDVWQSLKDKLDLGRNPAVETLANYVYSQIATGNQMPVNLVGHSQGALIISRALNDVRNRLRIERGLSAQDVESRLNNVTVTTFGGASGHYPDGPRYFHYINRGDLVAMPAGLGGDLSRIVPLFDGGRGARFIRFTDFSLPNAHDSNLYLNMYRRPESFDNGNNPYTPEEIRRYKIAR
jgi:hypothetical protein